ncbi:Xyloglucan-specific endo-beta-1,4-glucanase [Penicillium ucsense]|uniref:xyloglucan-specific endo-beta-1,4-glucanase n=1 Tax=Penicillium ucsense TaxID=2839758 RepID=A0A8J8W3X2_9EURO|nr:Xyloglucan-specific endo-beta-1,4-glucanase [Penicillium ucsense]KAF7734459.1 Xyloglucan-specific endo-beta-1,4-glucanase [Penicillium ucsense]
MAMRLVVNTVLLAIPIGGSLGALLGIDAHRSATGQKPLFNGDGSNAGAGSGGGGGHDSTGGGSGGGSSTTDNGVTNTQYCQQFYGISPPAKDGQLYTFNPNQWGLISGQTGGGLCVNVTTFDNQTYPTQYSAPGFSVTWQFDPAPGPQPVHAYPNIMVDKVLPLELGKMSKVDMDLAWNYAVGDEVSSTTDESALAASGVAANVAIDMFFDSDKTIAQNSSLAQYEVMVWFGRFNKASAQVIGEGQGVVKTKTVNGVNFDLYVGKNTNRAGTLNVLTWLANPSTQKFTGDIYPLITDLYTLKGDVYPSSSDYMGIFQFGTEAYNSAKNVTFSVPKFSVDIE